MEFTIVHLTHRITCSYQWIDAANLSGYYWITTSEIPNYPCQLIAKSLNELENEVKSVIDRWS